MADLKELYNNQTTYIDKSPVNDAKIDGSYYRLVDDTYSPRVASVISKNNSIQNATTDLRRETNYRENFKKKIDSRNGLYGTFSNTVKTQTNIGRKPVALSASGDFRLPPIETKQIPSSPSKAEFDAYDDQPDSIASYETIKMTKNILKFNFW